MPPATIFPRAKAILQIGFALLLCLSLPARAQTANRAELESILKAHLAAQKASDIDALLPTLAESTIAEMRNTAISAKEKFPPKLLKDSEVRRMMLIPFGRLEFVSIKQNGPRALLIYLKGNETDNLGQNFDEFFIADFVHQSNGWRILKAARNRNDAQTKKFKVGDLSFLDGPEYTPSPEVPPIPAEVKAADYTAYLDFFVLAQKLTVTINGESHEVSGSKGSQLILGGLKKGANHIQIQYQTLPGKINPGGNKLRIRVIGLRLNQYQAFTYKWNNNEGSREETIQMDDAILHQLSKAEDFY